MFKKAKDLLKKLNKIDTNTLDDDDSSEESSEIEPTEWMKKCGHNCQMWSEITNKIENATGKTIQLLVDTSEPAVEDRYVIVTTYEKDDSTVDDTSGISTNTRTRRGSKAPAPNEDEEDTLSIGSSVTYNQRVYANIIVFVCIIFTAFIC